jgi:2-polyprenyl-6-methoxyphenol hydroxylase-like FAD-dependent oxidoreductase
MTTLVQSVFEGGKKPMGDWRKGKRVAIAGAGPGGVSATLEFLAQGYDVRLFEKHPNPTPIGGGVLLSTPVLAIMRKHGIDVMGLGSKTRTKFANNKGKIRAALPFNAEVEKALGIPGWHYGMLRSNAIAQLMSKLPEGIIEGSMEVTGYDERGDEVVVTFENGQEVVADLLVAADGIHSKISEQAFGDPGIFHIGIRSFLAWCEDFGGIDRDFGVIHHSRNVQGSYFPMLHDGKPGWEWWVVERSDNPDTPIPDIGAHLTNHVANFADPMPRFVEHTDFDKQCFRWEIYNRPSLKNWCKGRVACVGDAVHPVSPYAAYGMGMAIEDGYVLARAMQGKDLANMSTIEAGCTRYEGERVDYVTHHVEFARKLGDQFHKAPAPVAWLRDTVFDNTKVLDKLLRKDYLADSEKMPLLLKELHV